MLASTSLLGSKPSSAFSLTSILTLVVGIIFGFGFAYIWMSVVTWKEMKMFSRNLWRESYLDTHRMDRNPLSHQAVVKATVQKTPMSIHDSEKVYYKVDRKVADDLVEKVRVLCWVMTSPSYHESRAKRIKETWGQRCNILLFVSSEEDDDLPAIAFDFQEQWSITKSAFSYVHKHYLDSADWFMRADDETYVIVENLRCMLQSHSPNEPIYFGRKFLKHIEQGYMSGGAGYVLSREALKRFVEVGLPDAEKCNANGNGLEDLELGKCLENTGVVTGDSRDSFGRGRFFPFQPEVHIIPGYLIQIPWYFEYTNSSYSEDTDCCSETAITFHHVDPDIMLIYDYFIYKLRP